MTKPDPVSSGRSSESEPVKHGGAKTPKIVVMILTYNCAHLLKTAYQKIPKDLVDVVFVTDDGSTDNVIEVAQSLGIEIIKHETNRGYGGNVKSGLKHALDLEADYVFEVHGDGAQFDPQALKEAIPFIEDGAHLILGSRFRQAGQARGNGMPLVRWLANRFLSYIDKRVLKLPLTEFHTGFRIYSRTLLETVSYDQNSDDYLFSFQIIAQAAYHDMQVSEVPVEADYISEHTSHALLGAALYAVRTFGVLTSYILARKGVRHSRTFPAQ